MDIKSVLGVITFDNEIEICTEKYKTYQCKCQDEVCILKIAKETLGTL